MVVSYQMGMGARPRIRDPREKDLGQVQAPVQIPSVYLPDYSTLPIKMQGKFGTCGGHAGSALTSFLNMQDLSPKFLWQEIKKIDRIALNDGTSMNFIAQALNTIGDCHENLLPNNLPGSIEEYTNPGDITTAMLNDAYDHGTKQWAYTDNPTMQQIKQAIYQNKGVIALVDCGDGWYTKTNGNVSWARGDILPLRLGKYIDGHFIVLYGYDEQYIYFRNSWSSAWASTTGAGTDGGNGYFDQSYIPHVKEIGTALPSESIQGQLVIQDENHIIEILKEIIAYYKSKKQ